MNTTENNMTEVFDFYRAAFVRDLKEKIARAAEAEDDADSLLDGDTIDGDVLGDCDQAAYNETLQNFGWRIGNTEVSEAFKDAGSEVYEGIDFDAMIKKIKTLA